MRRGKMLLAVSLPLLGLLGAAFLLDLQLAASTNRLFVVVFAALSVLVVGMARVLSRQRECLWPLVPFAVVLSLLTLTDTSPLKPFRRFYAAIEPGMREAEVLRNLDEHFPATSRYPRPALNRLVGPGHLDFILDPGDGRYDAEIVALDFADGRVVRKRYYPD